MFDGARCTGDDDDVRVRGWLGGSFAIAAVASCSLFGGDELSGAGDSPDSGSSADGGSGVDAPPGGEDAHARSDGGAQPGCNAYFCDGFEQGNPGDPCFGWKTLINASHEIITENCHSGAQCCRVCATAQSYNGFGEFQLVTPLETDGGAFQVDVWFRANEPDASVNFNVIVNKRLADGGSLPPDYNSSISGPGWLSLTASGMPTVPIQVIPETSMVTGPNCYVIDDVRMIKP